MSNGDWHTDLLHKSLENLQDDLQVMRTEMNSRFDKLEARLDNHSLAIEGHDGRIEVLEGRWKSVWSNGWKTLTAIIALLGVAVAWIKGGGD